MDKNTLVGFTLIGAVLIGFSIYNRPSQEEMERAQRYQDSIQTIELQEAAKREAEAAAQSAQALTLDSTSLFFGANQGTEQFTPLVPRMFPCRPSFRSNSQDHHPLACRSMKCSVVRNHIPFLADGHVVTNQC